jgi:metallo-beta-lactamase family protein
MSNISFLGAAKQVTGSLFMVENDGIKILIDCGMDMEKRKKEKIDPVEFPFDPSEIHSVVLTHAHIDHSGNLPLLQKWGFEGKIYSTVPTYYLTHLLLMDCAGINRKKISHLTGKKNSKRGAGINRKAFDSLYLEPQVVQTMKQFATLSFNIKHKIAPGVSIKFVPAGHLLGAAHIVMYLSQPDGSEIKIGLSGDIGRDYYPLLVDPEPMEEVDYLVSESTYGARMHEPGRDYAGFLSKVIHETCVDKPGRLVIPAFSVGRTQALLFEIKKMINAGIIPNIRVFVDSPLSLESTKAYQNLHKYLNHEAKQMQKEDGEIFDFDNLFYIENEKQSRLLAQFDEPAIIISASGMLDGGRIQSHIRHNIENPSSTILMVGFASPGTLGARLREQPTELHFDKRTYQVRAKIISTSLFSGHGDQADLLKFVGYQNKETLKNIFLVHGEEPSMKILAHSIHELGYQEVTIPEKNSLYELN